MKKLITIVLSVMLLVGCSSTKEPQIDNEQNYNLVNNIKSLEIDSNWNIPVEGKISGIFCGFIDNHSFELLGEARYRIFDALVEMDGFSFIAIGRPEAAGCYCKINSYLKEVIGLLAENYDYIVIDGEAGIEQINRRVMEKVTHLMLITDSSKKGTQVVQTIKQVADELVMYDKVGVIANRLPNLDVKQYMDVGDIPVLSYILSDASLAEFDLKGESVFYLDDDAAIVRGAKEALIGIGILEA